MKLLVIPAIWLALSNVIYHITNHIFAPNHKDRNKNKAKIYPPKNLSTQIQLGGKGGERGSGRVFSGFGIWPKYGAGIGKTINILTGSGIWLFPGKRDSPKIGYGMRDLCLHVCRECRKPSRPTGSSGQSESTRRALSDVSFQTKHPVECLVNRS